MYVESLKTELLKQNKTKASPLDEEGRALFPRCPYTFRAVKEAPPRSHEDSAGDKLKKDSN